MKIFVDEDIEERYAQGLYEDYLKEQIEQKDKEIERLNNIINEFDKWLLGEQMMFYRGSDDERLIRFGEIKYKWLKLKGDSSNE